MIHNTTLADATLSLDDALSAGMQTVPNCVAAGYVDMQTGFLLGIQGRDDASIAALEAMSTSIANLILGRGVHAFEQLLSGDGSASASGTVSLEGQPPPGSPLLNGNLRYESTLGRGTLRLGGTWDNPAVTTVSQK